MMVMIVMIMITIIVIPISVAALLRAWVYGRSHAGIWVRIPREACMSVCVDCCVLSGRGLCDGLITRPEKSYRLWCVVCDLETSWMRRSWPALGRSATGGEKRSGVLKDAKNRSPDHGTRQNLTMHFNSHIQYMKPANSFFNLGSWGRLLGSGGSMVAKLKLKWIDGRTPPGLGTAA